MPTRAVELPVPPAGKGATTSSSMAENTADCLPVTAAGGHVVNIGRLAGAPSKIDIDALSYRNLNVHGVSYGFGERAWELGENFTQLRGEVLPAVGRGGTRPVIDGTFDWENHAQASARLLSGAAHGKIVLAIE